jgi:hypothetical protein
VEQQRNDRRRYKEESERREEAHTRLWRAAKAARSGIPNGSSVITVA